MQDIILSILWFNLRTKSPKKSEDFDKVGSKFKNSLHKFLNSVPKELNIMKKEMSPKI